ncbi:MAG: hypothetical protein M1370_07560 [Bacteroidetes bacterium]|nr:hypothetical protein [Bacteroidota bacterium]MCL5025790.1 hypothetical protein [Chloroflexota bacterium]
MTQMKVDPLTDWKGFYEELQNESARGAVLIAAAFLDAQLRNLLSRSFVKNPKIVKKLLGTGREHAPLSSFSSRIDAAYCLGLISESMYDDLHRIRDIRNNFAHRMHGYSFDDPLIVSWCKSLKLPKMVTDALPEFPNTHRSMFLLGVTQLANWLALKTLEADHIDRSAPKDPSLLQVVR